MEDIYFLEVNTKYIPSSALEKTIYNPIPPPTPMASAAVCSKVMVLLLFIVVTIACEVFLVLI